jgi:hypothetical protein
VGAQDAEARLKLEEDVKRLSRQIDTMQKEGQ